MRQQTMKSSVAIVGMTVCCLLAVARAEYGGGGYQGVSLHAGFVGNYAGHLTGGEVLNALSQQQHHDNVRYAADKVGAHSGEHVDQQDFSEAVGGEEPQHQESLGDLGEHLSESHFPKDYSGGEDGGMEYAEAEAAASEHVSSVQSLDDHHLGGHQHIEESDFDSKPVPGIDHGKGAFSYSTTYEFEEPPADHFKLP